jgi:hypothetical protein
MLQKSLSSGIPFITSHVYHLQSAFKFNNLYFMTIQHIEKLVILENPAKSSKKSPPFAACKQFCFQFNGIKLVLDKMKKHEFIPTNRLTVT